MVSLFHFSTLRTCVSHIMNARSPKIIKDVITTPRKWTEYEIKNRDHNIMTVDYDMSQNTRIGDNLIRRFRDYPIIPI